MGKEQVCLTREGAVLDSVRRWSWVTQRSDMSAVEQTDYAFTTLICEAGSW